MKNACIGLFLPIAFLALSAFALPVQQEVTNSITVTSLGGGQAEVAWELSTLGPYHLEVTDITNGFSEYVIIEDLVIGHCIVSNLVVGHTYRYHVSTRTEWIVNEDVYH